MGGGVGLDELGAAKPWGGVQGPLPHARGARRLAPLSAAGIAQPRLAGLQKGAVGRAAELGPRRRPRPS